MPDSNKIKFGLSDVHYALATETQDSTTGAWTTTYGEFKAIPAIAKLSEDNLNTLMQGLEVYTASDFTENSEAPLKPYDFADEFAKDMFAVTANTEGRTLTEMLNQDMKIYDVRETKFSISQVIVTSTKDLPDEKASITSTVEAFADKKQLDLAVLVFTSILENGSVVYYGGNRAMWAHEAFPDENNEEHSFQDGLLSRKQQILPALTKVISSYS